MQGQSRLKWRRTYRKVNARDMYKDNRVRPSIKQRLCSELLSIQLKGY
jgi:hypothetical protein